MEKEDQEITSLFKTKVKAKINKLFGVISEYKIYFVKKGPKDANKIINEINDYLKEVKNSIKKDNFGLALDYLIFIKGLLEVLKNKYGVDTREAQSFILLLEKDWATFKKLFGEYPKSEWLESVLTKPKK